MDHDVHRLLRLFLRHGKAKASIVAFEDGMVSTRLSSREDIRATPRDFGDSSGKVAGPKKTTFIGRSPDFSQTFPWLPEKHLENI